MVTLKHQMTKGVVWTTIDTFTTQFVQFVFGIVIARIVSPADFGVLGILMVFISLSQVFIDSGFGKALIQKYNPTQEDYSTVFFFNLFISISLYGLFWIASPLIAKFYEMPELASLMRVLSLSLIINSLIIVPQALFSIRLDFRSLAIANFVSAVCSGIVGIVMAAKGFGVWALVGQTIVRSLFLAVVQIMQLKWFPSFVFSKTSFKSLYTYGVNLFGSSLIISILENLNSMVIGKLYKPKELGFYTRGLQFAGLPYVTITSIIYRVLFPFLASVKEDRAQLIQISKSVIRYLSFLTFPLFLWLAMIADPLVRILLTEKWLPAVPIIQIICLARMITVIAGVSVELLNAVGFSDLSLKQNILKATIRVVLLISAYKFGIVWIAVAELVSTGSHFFINTYYPGKILGYGASSQIRDFMPILLSAIFSTIAGFLSMCLFDNLYLKIIVALILSATSFVGFLYLSKQRDFFEMISQLGARFRKQ